MIRDKLESLGIDINLILIYPNDQFFLIEHNSNIFSDLKLSLFNQTMNGIWKTHSVVRQSIHVSFPHITAIWC